MYDLYSILDEMDEEYIAHYGKGHLDGGHSGRYPWGSGDTPFERGMSFKKEVDELKAKGMSEEDIRKGFGMSTVEWRAMKSISKSAQRVEDISRAKALKEQGYSNAEIGRRMVPPRNESTIREFLKEDAMAKADIAQRTANFLKDQVADKKYVDIGEGSERELSSALDSKITQERLKTASAMLEMEGYEVVTLHVPQVTNKRQKTTMNILAPEGTTAKELYEHLDEIKSVGDYETGEQAKKLGIKPPQSIDSSRVMVRYAEDGGKERDGVIELRRGVDDTSLGGSTYAQVRIAVDGTHYLKGMAVYGDFSNVPDGIDIVFNTNKTKDVPVMGPKENSVLKPLKKNKETGEIDMDNPFGATIKAKTGQREYIDPITGEKKLSVVNKVNEEGDWGEYSKTLSAQFLSKQRPDLVKKQLDLAYSEKLEEYHTIMSLTQPTVKKELLASFSDDCDASAVHLKAASLPRQAFQVLLPVTSLKSNEIYAPNFKDGEEVVLIRYPHAGIFEIPKLTVNNKNKEGIALLSKHAKDAVGINSKVADQLSGADFDGDTALVIPVNDHVKVQSSKPLEGLKNFDPKTEYKYYPGMKVISAEYKQKQMGIVTNLISDMTLKGAPEPDIVRAVKHSMVIIDAEKHRLDWQRSYKENGIEDLKNKYQRDEEGHSGASTLITRAKSEMRVDERKIFNIDRDTDPVTGEKRYRETGNTYTDNKGNVHKYQTESTKMAETNNAMTLVSKERTSVELLYANYANKVKALANTARKSYLSVPNAEQNKAAKEAYKAEVESLTVKLDNALRNAPKERQAQLVASMVVKAKKDANPDMEKAEEKKLRQQALSGARERFGASRRDSQINLTDREWDAIQAGALSNSMIKRVISNCDMDKVKERAMPRTTTISPGKQSRIKALIKSGYTIDEVAEAVSVSTSTVRNLI